MSIDRKKLFYIACANAATTMSAFAREQGVTPAAIHRVLGGQSKSSDLDQRINSFIMTELAKMRIQLPAVA